MSDLLALLLLFLTSAGLVLLFDRYAGALGRGRDWLAPPPIMFGVAYALWRWGVVDLSVYWLAGAVLLGLGLGLLIVTWKGPK